MQMNRLIEHLRESAPDEVGQTDGQLLDLVVRDRDGAALAALVRRHAPMVWGVCRRILPAHHDAEDAFQATFLVLVRKAEAVPRPELVGNWLYGVARQTAVRMRALAARRAVRERQVAVMPEPATADEYLWNDLRPVLDDELCHLPEKYRVLLVLCDLEERTRADVARQLAIPEGTVASRLATARAMLAKRLARRGLVVSGMLLGAVLASRATAEAVAEEVRAITSRTAALLEAGTGTAAAVSPTVAELIRGVTSAMRLSRIKAVTAALLAGGLALGGLSVGIGRSGGPPTMDRPNAPAPATANPPAPQKNRPDPPVAADGEIVGQLIDAATGKPVEGATVACGAVINDSGKGGGANAVTDAQGRYRLMVPSPGIYNVWLKAFDKDPAKTAAADDGILVEARKVSDSQLLLVTGRKVAGKVVDAGDKPAGDVRVSCNSAARPMARGVTSTTTKADGSFEFSLPPGRAYVYAIVPDGQGGIGARASAQAHIEVPPTGDVAAVTLTLKEPDGKFGDPVWLKRSTPGTQILRRDPAEAVSGVVVDIDGKPVAGAKVFREDGPIVAANDKGEFRVKSAKGTQFIMHAFAPGYHVWFGTPTSGDVLKIVLEPKPKMKDPPPAKKEEPPKPPEPLARLVSLSADKVPLRDALKKLAAAAGLEVEFDTGALKTAGLDLDGSVSARVENEPLAKAIGYVIDWNAHLGVIREVRRGKLVFTTLTAWQARIAEKLPEWLKPLYNRGLLATLDDDDAVVTVTAGAVVTDEILEKLKTLPRLRDLHIETTKALTPTGLAHLAKLSRLEKLSLYAVNTDGPGLGDDVIRSLAGLDSLRELSITECGTTDAGAKLLEKLPRLTSLSLRQEGRLTDEALKSIGMLTRLKELSLNSYVGTQRLGWMRFSAAGIRHLKGLKELESLHLVGQEVPAEALAFPKLTALSLGHSAIDDSVATKIGELRALRHLELTYCGLGDEGLKRIAALPELRRLSISSGAHVTDAGVGHFRPHKRLEHVTLRADGLTDKALEHLAQIETLTRLDLYGSGKTGVDQGRNFSIAGLQQLKKLPKLDTLWLTNFGVPGGGYGGLKELKHLRELTFMMANVTDAELESLAEALPAARISALTGGRDWTGPKRKP